MQLVASQVKLSFALLRVYQAYKVPSFCIGFLITFKRVILARLEMEPDIHHFDFNLDRAIREQVVERLEASPLLLVK